MVLQTVAAIAVMTWRGAAAEELDAVSVTVLIAVITALTNIAIEFLKRWQSRGQEASEVAGGAGAVADGAETIVDGATKLVSTQSTRLDWFQAELQKLDVRLRAQDERIARQDVTIADQAGQLEEARKDRAAQDQVIAALRRDKEALDDWVRRLTNNQEANMERIKGLDADIGRLKRERAEADAAHAADRERLEASLRILETGISRLSDQVRGLGHTPDWLP